MEWLNTLQDILINHWWKVLLWLNTPIVAGLSIWKIGSIIVKLIQNHIAKKYTKKQKEYTERLEKKIDEFKEFVGQTIKEEVKLYADSIKDGFNDLQAKTQEHKQKVYEEIFNKKQEFKEIVQEVKTDFDNEIKEISEEIPEPQEVIDEKVEELPTIEDLPKKKVDLL